MTFGWEQASSPVTDQVALMMCKSALAAGINTLDSARIYRFELAIVFLDRVACTKIIVDIS
jgi:aryl-alcohol dehydrogenase-like predicted oxidoreductase